MSASSDESTGSITTAIGDKGDKSDKIGNLGRPNGRPFLDAAEGKVLLLPSEVMAGATS